MGLFPPSAGGGEGVSHGYKGKGSLIHLLVDGKGKPLSVITTGADGNERKEVENLLTKATVVSKSSLAGRMIVLEADKGYDCGWLRQVLLSRGIDALFLVVKNLKQIFKSHTLFIMGYKNKVI